MKHFTTRNLMTVLVALAPLLVVSIALAQTSTNFDQSWHVLSGAGAPASSTNFAADGSLGQLAIGTAEDSNYRVESGYWYRPITTRYRCWLPIIYRGW